MQAKEMFDRLAIEIPDFKPIYDEHKGYYEDLLPHVLMGDFTRFIIDNYRNGQGDSPDSRRHMDSVKKSLAFIERVMSDPELRELISVSFLENLHQAEDDYKGVKALLGQRLKRELAAYEA